MLKKLSSFQLHEYIFHTRDRSTLYQVQLFHSLNEHTKEFSGKNHQHQPTLCRKI